MADDPTYLVAEDGTGLPLANGYCTLAFGDTYSAITGNAAWAGYTSAQKQIAIISASQYIDTKCTFIGQKATYNQGMQWPRIGAFDTQALMTVPPNIVPNDVAKATMELALKVASGTTLFQDLDRGGLIKSESVSGLSVTYMDGAPGEMTYGAMQMMQGLLRVNADLPPLEMGIVSPGSPGLVQGMFDIPGLREGINARPPFED